MTDNLKNTNPLENAESQLLEICERHEQFGTPIDTGSLGRMAVHIRNISRSVGESTRDHANAAKRLADFATTLGRIAKNSSPGSEELARRMSALAETLRTAGNELATASADPAWAHVSAPPSESAPATG
jgi:hypothetical protein